MSPRFDEKLNPQLLPLTLNTTGKVKFSPSSATRGGGGGTGSERRTIASAASSNAEPPVPEPVQHEADQDFGGLLRALGRIALMPVQMRDQLLLPGHAHALRALAGALRGSHRLRSLRK